MIYIEKRLADAVDVLFLLYLHLSPNFIRASKAAKLGWEDGG